MTADDYERLRLQVQPMIPVVLSDGAENNPLLPRADKEGVDPDYPIRTCREAIEVLAMWDVHRGRPQLASEKYAYYFTHGHAHEWPDIEKYGPARGYIRSEHTKHVSIGWHLTGRYDQDVPLTRAWEAAGRPAWRLLDYGAAPWVQSIFFAKKGMHVIAVNQSVESECHQFGRFLAGYCGVTTIRDFSADDPAWRRERLDVAYAIDVLEHIVPNPDGSPGWVSIAEDLYRCLEVGGVWYANAPILVQPGPCVPNPEHLFHFTAPFDLQAWMAQKGTLALDDGVYRKVRE